MSIDDVAEAFVGSVVIPSYPSGVAYGTQAESSLIGERHQSVDDMIGSSLTEPSAYGVVRCLLDRDPNCYHSSESSSRYWLRLDATRFN